MRSLSKILLAVAAVAILAPAALLASGVINAPLLSDDRVDAVVTIAPQQSMVESIGGDRVRVTLMVPAGQDLHSYEPTSGKLGKVSSADIYFMVGSGVEFELTRMSTLREINPDMAVVDCSNGITLIEQVTHHHDGHEHDHEHEGNDPHIWLSPMNLKFMAMNVFDGLVAVDPEHAEEYEQNLQAYTQRMDSLHEMIGTELDAHQGRGFMIFHPAWGYFAHEYGLVQIAIEQEGQEAGSSGIEDSIEEAREQGIHVIFTSPQTSVGQPEVIAEEIGGKVVVVDPLSTDLESELLTFAKEIAKSYGQQEG